jgi:hypothetical protein
MGPSRRAVAFAIALAAVVLAPATAHGAQEAGPLVDEAARALRTDPVFVHPDAEYPLNDEETERLRERIAESQAGPIYIAVLPDEARAEAGGDASEVVQLLGEALGRDGTYGVVVGDEFWAGSTEFESAPIADEAVREQGEEGVSAVLMYFVDRLNEVAQGGSTTSEDPSSGFGLLPVVLILGALALVAFAVTQRRKRREQQELEEVRQVAMEDLVSLGDDLRALDLDVEMPGADPKAKEDYVRALECYETATGELDSARRAEDLRPVTATLEKGRYAMASAKARLDGRPPPEHRAPCFFDPRHGPSVRDVEWAPPGGAPRAVPACADDVRRIEQGEEPLTREISVDGRRRPYWDAPSYYGPWAGGYFSSFGLLEGLLIGSLLSGGWGGWGYGGYGDGGDSGGGDGGGDLEGADSGDFGGGDLGGGDFGGGDFGGGDFGGGDFGG